MSFVTTLVWRVCAAIRATSSFFGILLRHPGRIGLALEWDFGAFSSRGLDIGVTRIYTIEGAPKPACIAHSEQL